MDAILNIIYYIVPFIILLGILVFVHEFGHFIIARMLGVTVTDFSIGFGKELWSRTDKYGTKWKISAIPLGGYCQFLGDGDASSSTVTDVSALSEEQQKGAFQLQKPWKKLAIVSAGPLFNYLFAILVFIGLFYTMGRMVFPAVVGGLMENGAAQEAGIKIGDKIVRVNEREVFDFKDISSEVMLAEKDNIAVDVERPMNVSLQAEELNFTPRCETKSQHRKIIGIQSLPMDKDEKGELISAPAVVGDVYDGSAAQKAGLLKNDVLISINGVALNTFDDLKNYVETHIDDEFIIEYRRPLHFDVELKVTEYEPENGAKVKRRMLGVISAQEVSFAEENMPLMKAVKAGFVEAYDLTANTLRAVGQMVTGQRGGGEVGGIIRIAEMSGDVTKTGGLVSFLYFMALLSVNLGLINLLPIPVLDGGNFVIFFIEMIIRRELNPKVKDWIFKFGIAIILAIMVLATWNDVVHLISRWFD